MKKNKNRITTVLLALVFLAGLSLLLYPTVSALRFVAVAFVPLTTTLTGSCSRL